MIPAMHHLHANPEDNDDNDWDRHGNDEERHH